MRRVARSAGRRPPRHGPACSHPAVRLDNRRGAGASRTCSPPIRPARPGRQGGRARGGNDHRHRHRHPGRARKDQQHAHGHRGQGDQEEAHCLPAGCVARGARCGGQPGRFVRISHASPHRGADGNHVLVLVDGIEVSAVGKGEVDLSSLRADNINRVEVLRGPQSGLYGSNALAGVITSSPREATLLCSTPPSNTARSPPCSGERG